MPFVQPNSNHQAPSETSNSSETCVIAVRSTGSYTFQTDSFNLHASMSPDARPDFQVVMRNEPQEWAAEQLNQDDQYIVRATLDVCGVWRIQNGRSSITIEDSDNVDERNQWTFHVTKGVKTGGTLNALVLNTNLPDPGPASGALPGLTDWRQVHTVLSNGNYTILNRHTRGQCTLEKESIAPRILVPFWVWDLYCEDAFRTFEIELDAGTGGVAISSTYGGRRYLWDGPNYRPGRNLCRLWAVPNPGVGNWFVICTNMETNPPMVLQDVQGSNMSHVIAMSAPFSPGDISQHWEFKKL